MLKSTRKRIGNQWSSLSKGVITPLAVHGHPSLVCLPSTMIHEFSEVNQYRRGWSGYFAESVLNLREVVTISRMSETTRMQEQREKLNQSMFPQLSN